MNKCLELFLPYPPSVNTYWGFHGHRRFLTKKALLFKELVNKEISNTPTRFGGEYLSITLWLYPPDKRKRDIDNPVKPLLDALVSAGLFDDDSQIKELTIKMNEPKKFGLATLKIVQI